MQHRRNSRSFTVALFAIVLFGAATNALARGWHLRVVASLCQDDYCGGGGAEPGPLSVDSAGNLFGVMSSGGLRGSGEVFELVKESGRNKRTFRVIYDFCALNGCMDGGSPQQTGLVEDGAGNIYGIASSGGAADGGTLFKLTPNKNGKHWNLTVLYNFCSKNSACTDGGQPHGVLTYQGASQGQLYDGVSPIYGTAYYGSHGKGVVFSLMPKQSRAGGWGEKVLYAFCGKAGGTDCNEGENPYGVTLDSMGNLIGVAGGGSGKAGILFKLSPVVGERKWTETLLYTFCSLKNCADGSKPLGAPVVDQAGNIFGSTYTGGTTQCFNGGVGSCGVLYELTPDGTETVLYNFCSLKDCKDGAEPQGTLIADASGNLYGTTIAGGGHDNDFNAFGGGTVFRFSGGSLETLHAFCSEVNCPDGEYPYPGVVLDSFGNLFGTTEAGGPNQSGEVFELTP